MSLNVSIAFLFSLQPFIKRCVFLHHFCGLCATEQLFYKSYSVEFFQQTVLFIFSVSHKNALSASLRPSKSARCISLLIKCQIFKQFEAMFISMFTIAVFFFPNFCWHVVTFLGELLLSWKFFIVDQEKGKGLLNNINSLQKYKLIVILFCFSLKS